MIRPEHLHLATGGPDAGGRVVDLAFHGHETLVTVDIKAIATSVVARLPGIPDLRPGDNVTVTVTGKVRFYPDETGAGDPVPG